MLTFVFYVSVEVSQALCFSIGLANDSSKPDASIKVFHLFPLPAGEPLKINFGLHPFDCHRSLRVFSPAGVSPCRTSTLREIPFSASPSPDAAAFVGP